MKNSLPSKHDYLKHFAKDGAGARIAALVIVKTPAILLGVAAVLGVLLSK